MAPGSLQASGDELLVDRREVLVAATPAAAFAPIRRIGGENGWYYANWLWRFRCGLDSLVGGPGLRGRRDPEYLAIGDCVDCWRVEEFQPDRRLRLLLQLRQPGRGWLEFEVERNGAGSLIRQTAMYEPGGLLGRAYWRLVSPLHALLFRGLLRGIARRARAAGAPRESA